MEENNINLTEDKESGSILSAKDAKKAAKEAKKLEKVKKLFKKSKIDEKNKEYFEFDKSLIKDKKQLQRINIIAKEIGKQKGRVNILAFLGAVLCVAAVLFFIYIFRNVLARKIVVGASEAAFGAKCEVSLVDFDLLKTRFRIQEYKVAYKNAPMQNLFEIKNMDFYFNLLELSRGKFVAENMAIEGFTWNTARKTSGALPPKKQKPVDPNAKPNPVTALINKELAEIKSEVSVSSGLKAVQDQVDPQKILEREKKAFRIPVKELISIIVKVSETGKADFDLAEKLFKEVQVDIKTIEDSGKNAADAVKSDFNHIKDVASKIKSVNADAGKKLVAQLINTFVINTLGTYYPYFAQGMEYLQNSQKKQEPKEQSLAQKSKMMGRLAGTTFIFGKHSLPSFVIKNVSLSGHHPEKDVFAIGGTVKSVTNDADKLGLPLTINLNAAHAEMKETASGIIDLRSYTKELVDTMFTFEGLELNLPQPVEAVPSLTGILKTSGGVKVSKEHDTVITADMGIINSSLQAANFEPAFICEIYQNILAEIKAINAKLTLTINKGEKLHIDITTDVDDQIAAALKKEFARQIKKIKAELIKIAEKWLDEQKEIYKDELAKFTSIANQAKKIMNDFKNYEQILEKKKAEAERRIRSIAEEKAKQLIDQGKDKAQKAVDDAVNEKAKDVENTIKDALKGLF